MRRSSKCSTCKLSSGRRCTRHTHFAHHKSQSLPRQRRRWCSRLHQGTALNQRTGRRAARRWRSCGRRGTCSICRCRRSKRWSQERMRRLGKCRRHCGLQRTGTKRLKRITKRKPPKAFSVHSFTQPPETSKTLFCRERTKIE